MSIIAVQHSSRDTILCKVAQKLYTELVMSRLPSSVETLLKRNWNGTTCVSMCCLLFIWLHKALAFSIFVVTK